MAAALWCAAAALALPEQPESPALDPAVVATVAKRPVHGHVSGRRSTQDGRVRITGTGDVAHKFHTARVELFIEDLTEDERFSDGRRLRVDPGLFHASTAPGNEPGHVTLCDPYLAPGTSKNPYACRRAGKPADCYDLTVLQIVNVPRLDAAGRGSELWSAPVTITVAKPKTDEANVAEIALRGPPVRSPLGRPPRNTGEVLVEPVTSGDGRLLVLNSGSNLLYSVMPSGAPPCDARHWRRLDHISRMHGDADMARYGIARYPIRDAENKRVRAGRAVRGAYPWIDRDGRNLFFTQVSGTGLFYEDGDGKLRSRFEVLNRPQRRRIELGGATRFGMSWLGLWSQGKIVIPDTRVNSVDFSLGRTGYRARLQLYGETGSAVSVGEGTITKINSPENEWNYRPALLPRAPRDVVWWLSANNDMTGEVVFDDVLDLGSLIFSPMNASVNNKKRKWRDGFDYGKKSGYTKAARVQNAAASEIRWRLPAYGRLSGGRIEPIAAGGVTGKGLWLDGSGARLAYTIPAQPGAAMTAATWATSIWIDPRDLATRRRLLDFPDGSWIELAAGALYLGGNGAEVPVAFPASAAPRSRAWTHLAFVSRPRDVDVYVQGFKLATIAGPRLRIAPGELVLGDSTSGASSGFRGWVDELRVASGDRDPETICNWAGGTLRGLDPLDDATDFTGAASYPTSAHQEISSRLAASGRATWERYRCERSLDREPTCLDQIHLPGGADPRCVRAALLFPEGPIRHDRPRPDSRGNRFCQTCHSGAHPTPTLRVTVPLRAGADGTALIDDPRRQPSQAPARLHGFVPRELLGLERDLEAPSDGLPLDPILYPAAGGTDSEP